MFEIWTKLFEINMSFMPFGKALIHIFFPVTKGK